MDGMARKCPLHGSDMERVDFYGVEVDRCPACGGMWFDRNELDRVLRVLLQAPGYAAKLDRPVPDPDTHSRKNQYEILACPACGNKGMAPGKFGGSLQVVVDRCQSCGGTWLDRGELKTLMQSMVTPDRSDRMKMLGEAVADELRHKEHYLNLSELGGGMKSRVGMAWLFLPKIILPISAGGGSATFPLVTLVLVLLNVVALVVTSGGRDLSGLGVIPAEIMEGRQLNTLVTAMFVHAGFMHLLGNMIYLWVFSTAMEDVAGPAVFLVGYLLCGIVSESVFVLTNPNLTVPLVGASGAVSGVMGAYLARFPSSAIRTVVINRVLSIPAWLFLGIWIGFQVLLASLGGCSCVAYSAHVGGFICGVLLGISLKLWIE